MENRKLVRTIHNITYAGIIIEEKEENRVTLKVHMDSEFLISIPVEEIKEII